MNEKRQGGRGVYVASNGHQTDDVLDYMIRGGSLGFDKGLTNWEYEPNPNHTARITGAFFNDEKGWHADMSLIRHVCNGEDDSLGNCIRESFYTTNFNGGFGCCLTTYTGDGNPLPCFRGAPYTVPLQGATPVEIAQQYWRILNEENKVAIAVKFIDVKTGRSEIAVLNKYQPSL